MAAVIGSSTNNPRTYWMQYLFNGQMFKFGHTYSIASLGTAYMQGIVPAGKLIHIFSRTMDVEGGGPVTCSLYEAPTITDGTTPPDITSNLDRRSAKTPTFLNYINPTGVSGGTLIDRDVIPTGGGPKTTASFVSGATERILKPSTKYCLVFYNGGTQTSSFTINITWYESGN
jgi:hypothetical protein